MFLYRALAFHIRYIGHTYSTVGIGFFRCGVSINHKIFNTVFRQNTQHAHCSLNVIYMLRVVRDMYIKQSTVIFFADQKKKTHIESTAPLV